MLSGLRQLCFVAGLVAAAGAWALPEIDPEFSRHPAAIVAIGQNGRPLTARDGPLQLVLPGDKRHARWVRSLTSLQVLAAPEGK